jgi:YD repeat-containing protein
LTKSHHEAPGARHNQKLVFDYRYDRRGNLVGAQMPEVEVAGGNRVRPENSWKYNGAGQVVEKEDAEKNVTRYGYYMLRTVNLDGTETDPLRDGSVPEYPLRIRVGGMPSGVGDGGAPISLEELPFPVDYRKMRFGYLALVHDVTRGAKLYFGRDERGNATVEIDPRGVVSQSRYDARDRLLEHRPASDFVDVAGTDPDQKRALRSTRNIPRTFYEYNLDGNPILTRTEDRASHSGGSYVSEFDALGQVVRETREVDTGRTVATTYEQDKGGNLTVVREHTVGAQVGSGNRPPSDSKAIANETKYKYDLGGRIVQETTGSITTSYKYDNRGNLVSTHVEGRDRKELRFYDGFGRLVGLLSPSGGLSLMRYDGQDKMVDMQVWGLRLDLIPETETAAELLAERFRIQFGLIAHEERTHNAQGLLKHVQKATGREENDSPKLTQSFTYNRLGEVLTDTADMEGTIEVRTFSSGRLQTLNRRESRHGKQPDELELTFQHDSASNVIELKQSSGRKSSTTVQVFDALGRMVEQGVDDVQTTYQYDARGNVLHAKGPAATFEYRYNLANQRVETTRNEQRVSSVEYRDDGLVEAKIDAHENRTSYVYNENGQITKVTLPGESSYVLEYAPSGGKLRQSTDPTGTIVELDIDDAGRMVGRKIKSAGHVGWTKVEPQTFVVDPMGRWLLAREGGTVEYRSFDGIGRVLAEGFHIHLNGFIEGEDEEQTPMERLLVREHQTPIERLMRFEYDDGLREKKTIYETTGLVVTEEQQGNYVSSWSAAFSSQGQPVLAASFTTAADGKLESMQAGDTVEAGRTETDEAEIRASFQYTPQGTPKTLTQWLGQKQYRVDRDYYENGLLKNSVQKLIASDYTYDGSQRPKEVYEAIVFPHTETNPVVGKSRETLSAYDSMNRLVSREIRSWETVTQGPGAGRWSFETEHIEERYGSLDPLNGYREIHRGFYDRDPDILFPLETSVTSLDFTSNGSLRRIQTEGNSPIPQKNAQFQWDPYTRLRQFEQSETDSNELLVISDRSYRQETRRVAKARYLYGASGRRLLKWSRTSFDTKQRSEDSEDPVDYEGIFRMDRMSGYETYTYSGEQVVEESGVYWSERANQLRYWSDPQKEWIEIGSRNPEQITRAYHRQFATVGGRHQGVIVSSIGNANPQTSIVVQLNSQDVIARKPEFSVYRIRRADYIIRDEGNQPLFLAAGNGTPVLSFATGYEGVQFGVLEQGTSLQNRLDRPDIEKHYSYLHRGAKYDFESGFTLMGRRYYAPDRSRTSFVPEWVKNLVKSICRSTSTSKSRRSSRPYFLRISSFR